MKIEDANIWLNCDREIEIENLMEYVDTDGIETDYILGPISEESISNQVERIRESGFRRAVDVWELDGEYKGMYMIISGFLSVAAVKALGETKVKCDVYPYPDNELDRRLQFLRANIHSRGSIKASEEVGDIYIARQIKYLEDILRKKGIKGNINQRICEEFNVKRNTVWKYKSLLRACDELLKAEAEGHICIEQAAAICRYNKEDQKAIVKVIEDVISKGHILNGKDIDKLTKQLRETKSDEEVATTDLQERAARIISNIINDKKEIEEPSVLDFEENKDRKSMMVYDKYLLRISQIKNDVNHNCLNSLKPAEVENLMREHEALGKSLARAHLFSELMAGYYKGSPIGNGTKIDSDDLRSLNPLQMHKLTKAYEKILDQLRTIQTEQRMTFNEL